jgi:hypothetical protein
MRAPLLAVTVLALLSASPLAQAQSACDNGDLESGLAFWSAAGGVVLRNGEPRFLNLTPLVRLTNDGADPIVPIRTVARDGSTQAVRIGDEVCDARADALSRTFTVTADHTLIDFSYAVVLQDPGHDPIEQPSFHVRISNAAGVIEGIVNLGNGTGTIIAGDSSFLSRKPGTDVVYRDWSCGRIDLSGHVGETVTVQFITEDCAIGGHFGYAYVDDFCGSQCERFELLPGLRCGLGTLCFDSFGMGSVTITLDFLQSGHVIDSMVSPVLAGESRYCFPIDPSKIIDLSTAPGGFDFVATARFVSGTTISEKYIGMKPAGVDPGLDNDYRIVCTGCCPSPNLLANGDFEAGIDGIVSSYDAAAEATMPRLYAVVEAGCGNNGKSMVVNGATGVTEGPESRLVWSQTVPVEPGTEYRFCAHLRNRPQCGFDVLPQVELRLTPADVTDAVPIEVACGDEPFLLSGAIRIPEGVTSLTPAIWLLETGQGDGNDLAIDDVSLQQTTPADPKYGLLSIVKSAVAGGSYNVSATPMHGQPFEFSWEVCEIDGAGDCVAGTRVANPPQWRTTGAFDFPGYGGTSTLSGTSAGAFDATKKYRITYAIFGLCTSRSESIWALP